MVAHILGYIALSTKPQSSSGFLDRLYQKDTSSIAQQQMQEIEGYIQTEGKDVITQNYLYVQQVISKLFQGNDLKFNSHILGLDNTSHDCPRYYQAVFLAFYELIINEENEINDEVGLLGKLKNVGVNEIFKTTKGKTWTASKREEIIKDLKGLILRFFKPTVSKRQNTAWVTEIDNLLTISESEQALYDFKIGMMNLDGSDSFNDECLTQVLNTCVAINNIGKSARGSIVIGIADKSSDSKRVNELYGVNSIQKSGFDIVGIDNEAKIISGSIDKYLHKIKGKIDSNYSFDEKLKQMILKDIKVCKYDTNKHLIKIDIKSIGNVCGINNKFYLRQGPNTDHMETTDEIGALYTNYMCS